MNTICVYDLDSLGPIIALSDGNTRVEFVRGILLFKMKKLKHCLLFAVES